MNSMEKSMLLDELFSLRKADKAEREQLLAKLDHMTEQLLTLNESSQAQTRMIDELKRMQSDRDALIEKLRKEIAALKEQKKLSAKNRFGSKTQKVSSTDRGSDFRETDREDFDGSSTPGLPSEETGADLPSSTGGKQDRPYRQGMSYKRMKAVQTWAVFRKEITRQRNSLRTRDVISCMCSFLNVLTSEGHLPYTLLSTSRVNGIFALAYLNKFFREVIKGRRDYENLLPMTIGINTNKL